MERVSDRLWSWASDIEEVTLQQALTTSRLPVVSGHVALMPYAHVGVGAPVGSVIPTDGAVIPAAVGVDIGCGLMAVRTSLHAGHLPDDLDRLRPVVERAVPAGPGQEHPEPTAAAHLWYGAHPPPMPLPRELEALGLAQFGTLGSGNHFLEIGLDELDRVWVVLHSGSRDIGRRLATEHIETARTLGAALNLDSDIGWLVQGTNEFMAYLGDEIWAQAYAAANRAQMMDVALGSIFRHIGMGAARERVDCQHNFVSREDTDEGLRWITRRGAIRAGRGELAVIPGAMGACTYIVRGLGSPDSYQSCAHAVGGPNRSAPRRELSAAARAEAVGGRAWRSDEAGEKLPEEAAAGLMGEPPAADREIGGVIADQSDLVEVMHVLRPIFNHKGTDAGRRLRLREEGLGGYDRKHPDRSRGGGLGR